MKASQELSETPIVTNQVPYSLTTRRYVQNGVIPYCQANNIAVTAYSPVEEGRLGVQTVLTDIATAHRATPYQIAIAWLVEQPWVITIPMSHKSVHLQQNWDAATITLTPDEIARLDTLG